jgi:hypothetical protein
VYGAVRVCGGYCRGIVWNTVFVWVPCILRGTHVRGLLCLWGCRAYERVRVCWGSV